MHQNLIEQLTRFCTNQWHLILVILNIVDIFKWDQVPLSYIENEWEFWKWYEYWPFVSTKNPLQWWGRSYTHGIASVECQTHHIHVHMLMFVCFFRLLYWSHFSSRSAYLTDLPCSLDYSLVLCHTLLAFSFVFK